MCMFVCIPALISGRLSVALRGADTTLTVPQHPHAAIYCSMEYANVRAVRLLLCSGGNKQRDWGYIVCDGVGWSYLSVFSPGLHGDEPVSKSHRWPWMGRLIRTHPIICFVPVGIDSRVVLYHIALYYWNWFTRYECMHDPSEHVLPSKCGLAFLEEGIQINFMASLKCSPVYSDPPHTSW